MAVDAYIGEPFVFNEYYVDNTGAPVVMLNLNITLFRFDALGDTVTLINAAVMSPADTPDPGRYVYAYMVPPSLVDGTTLYSEIRATDPITGFVSVSNETLNLRSRPTDLGLRSRFVK